MKFALITFFALISIPMIAYACTCVPADDVNARDAYEQADTIVNARVLMVSKGWGASGPLATLEILNTLKGEETNKDIVVIQYNPSISACGMTLVEGDTYILGMYDIRNVNSTKARVQVGYTHMWI